MKSCDAKRRRQRRLERWKTTIGLISKRATLHMQHTFLYISLPLFCTTTTWNFQELLSHTFYAGNVVRFIVQFFFPAAHFHLSLVAASISHFLTIATNFHGVLPTKNVSFVLYSRSRSLSLFFLDEICWPAAYFLFFSVFLFLYIDFMECELHDKRENKTITVRWLFITTVKLLFFQRMFHWQSLLRSSFVF